jgi:hypothetical protein
MCLNPKQASESDVIVSATQECHQRFVAFHDAAGEATTGCWDNGGTDL